MKRVAVLLSGLFLAGCYTEVKVEGVTGDDLEWAYKRCVKYADDDFNVRLACTQAVYGGVE